MKTINIVITIILSLAIISAIAVIIYFINSSDNERFTEFYLLGPDGKADRYPSEVVVGEVNQVTAGIINKEEAEKSYSISVSCNGMEINNIASIVLQAEEKWEQVVSFTLESVGKNQQVDFFLFKNGDTTPYLKLRLFVNVTS